MRGESNFLPTGRGEPTPLTHNGYSFFIFPFRPADLQFPSVHTNPVKKSHKRSKSEVTMGSSSLSALRASSAYSQSTDNIDTANLKHGLAFGKCPQHLLTATHSTLTKTGSSSSLKDLPAKPEVNQCCCWQVRE